MPPRSKRLLLLIAVASLLVLSVGLSGCARLTPLLEELSSSAPAPANDTRIDENAGPADLEAGPGLTLPGFDELGEMLFDEGNWVLLIALVGLGVVLFLVTAGIVYYLIRRSPHKRQRVEEATAESRDILQEGALVHNGLYRVVGPVDGGASPRGAGDMAWRVRATTSLTLCPRCYSVVAESGDALPLSLCSTCGAVQQQNQNPSEPAALILREIDVERFGVVSELLARKLSHWAVVMPVDAFEIRASDAPHYYQIEPVITSPPASVIVPPQSLGHVLAWGDSLARGLEYLHQNQVVMRTPRESGAGRGALPAAGAPPADLGAPDEIFEQVGKMIILDGEEARWLCFDGVLPLVLGDEQDVLSAQQQNVRELAGCLLKLATGDAGNGGLEQLPKPVKAVMEQALSHDVGSSAAQFVTLLEENRREFAYQTPVHLLIGARSDVGRLRKLNEDSLLAKDYSDLFANVNVSVGLVAVADGVGGNAAGDVASRLTVEALADFGDGLRRTAANGHIPDPEPWIVQAALLANQEVYRERQVASNDMGCTLVMALFVGSAATLLNVGDSRAYRLRPQGINQVTVDHSLVQRLIDIGQLTKEQARHHPQKSVIYRVMGDSPDLAYDIFNVILQPGEALLLCSDGLSDMVEDDVLWQAWRAASSPNEACQRLVALANDAGGYDNITAVMVQVA
jgi:serine/threonine protein phosphatase PrpC